MTRVPAVLPCDTHTHTVRCGHAQGRDEELVGAALERGLAAIAITDHVPFYWLPPDRHDPTLAMASDELPAYVESVLELQGRYRGRIEVLLGIEADYVPGHEETLARLLAAYPFDVVLGSVHLIDGWLVDAPSSLERLSRGQGEVDRIWARYAELVIAAAGSGLFDVLAHLDLPKKFGHRPSRPFAGVQDDVVATVAASSCAVEISSGGRRKPVGEDYPGGELLRALAASGVPFVLASDAHGPGEVGYAFEEMLAAARSAGIASLAAFQGRRARAVAL